MSPDWKEMWRLDGRGFLRDPELSNKNWLEDYIPAEDQPAVLAAIEDAIQAALSRAVEWGSLSTNGGLE